jgi:hypothetical protein
MAGTLSAKPTGTGTRGNSICTAAARANASSMSRRFRASPVTLSESLNSASAPRAGPAPWARPSTVRSSGTSANPGRGFCAEEMTNPHTDARRGGSKPRRSSHWLTSTGQERLSTHLAAQTYSAPQPWPAHLLILRLQPVKEPQSKDDAQHTAQICGATPCGIWRVCGRLTTAPAQDIAASDTTIPNNCAPIRSLLLSAFPPCL